MAPVDNGQPDEPGGDESCVVTGEIDCARAATVSEATQRSAHNGSTRASMTPADVAPNTEKRAIRQPAGLRT